MGSEADREKSLAALRSAAGFVRRELPKEDGETRMAEEPAIFFPKRMPMESFRNMSWMAATAFFPMRSPGLGIGAKKVSSNFSRIPRFRSACSTLNMTSNTGPPRTAGGHWPSNIRS